MIEYFAKTYVDTTNHTSPYTRIMAFDVLLSIILHTLFYVFMTTVFGYVFDIERLLQPAVLQKLAAVLVSIMILGYFGRLMRSKAFAKYYGNSNRSLIDKGYFRFYFIG